jgi:hypothetical protein
MLCHTQGHGKDTRNRFGIQFNPGKNSILLNCFNCGFSASYSDGKGLSNTFKTFLEEIHIDQRFINQIEFEIFRQRNQIRVLRDGDEPEEDRESVFRSLLHKWQPTELPENSLSIQDWLENGLDDPDFLKVTQYALSRKIYDLENFFWTPISSHNLNKRIIIPFRYKGSIVGFTSRLCYDTVEKTIPKYYQQCPQDFVHNLDDQQGWTRKYVIVTEGVLDAWAVDGVSVLGEVGQTKVDIINRLQKDIIVCPDRDKKGKDLVDVAIKNNWAVSFPKWDKDIKDAAGASEKYGRLLTTHSIISSAITGKDKIQLFWNMEQNERARKRK